MNDNEPPATKVFKIDGPALEKIKPLIDAGTEWTHKAAAERTNMEDRLQREGAAHHKAIWNAIREATGHPLDDAHYRLDETGMPAGVLLVTRVAPRGGIQSVINALGLNCPDCEDPAKEGKNTVH